MLFKLISEFSNSYLARFIELASRYKINIQNLPAFLYTNHEQLETEVKSKNNAIKNSTKNMKYLEIKICIVKTTKYC